jgi:hypothetical protein
MSAGGAVSDWLPALWFVAAVVGVGWLVLSGAAMGLVQRVTKFSGFGVAFDFTNESASKTRDSIEEGLGAVRARITRELESEVRTLSISSALQTVLTTDPVVREGGYRAAIHIPDPLYQNYLYQLVDYFPKGGGHGRAFSTRAGLIGRCWRLSTNDQSTSLEGVPLSMLMEDWGMTYREASARQVDHTKVMLAILLRDESGARPLGVLYLDSEDGDRFGSNDVDRLRLMARLEASARTSLSPLLTQVVEKALRNSPQITLEGA